jgi:hypothetical protein
MRSYETTERNSGRDETRRDRDEKRRDRDEGRHDRDEGRIKEALIRPPIPLLVYDSVTESAQACEHVIWFSRCEGDVYEIIINGVPVAKGTGAQLDVAHAKNYSSTALVTQEKISFPLAVGINVYRGHELFGQGVGTVYRPGEALPTT